MYMCKQATLKAFFISFFCRTNNVRRKTKKTFPLLFFSFLSTLITYAPFCLHRTTNNQSLLTLIGLKIEEQTFKTDEKKRER